jgi:hypothetical protein
MEERGKARSLLLNRKNGGGPIFCFFAKPQKNRAVPILLRGGGGCGIKKL